MPPLHLHHHVRPPNAHTAPFPLSHAKTTPHSPAGPQTNANILTSQWL